MQFWQTTPEMFRQNPKFLKIKKKLFKKFFSLKKFTWTRGMQFWQPCRKVFAKTPGICRLKSENFKKLERLLRKNTFHSKRSSEHVECNFNNPAQNFSPKVWDFFAQSPKITEN